MNPRRLNATRRLPLQSFERYKPPEGKWAIFEGIKIDPRIDSKKLRKELMGLHETCNRDIGNTLDSYLLKEKRDEVEEAINNPHKRDDFEKTKVRRRCAPNSVHLSSYEHKLIGSTTTCMIEVFTPPLVQVLGSDIVSKLRHITGPEITAHIEFLMPFEEVFRRSPLILMAKHFDMFLLLTEFRAPLDKNGRLIDYPVIKKVTIPYLPGDKKAMSFKSGKVIDNIAVKRSFIHEKEGIAYFYDIEDCLKIVKLD